MKKLMALVLFVGTTLSFTACSSDDNSAKRVEAKVEGTWYADKLTYTMPGHKDPSTHPYTDMPGENKVAQTDKLVITKDQAELTEYFVRNNGEPTITKGKVNNGIITFDKEGYSPRTINGIVNGQLSLTYNITMYKTTLPVTVTYNAGK
ncbi:hypothetical protein [Myroides sp.]|uniref:hypothetical protein n=1 Tax=Myroides sp. TaxID=1874736 RepID=UPI003F2A6F36